MILNHILSTSECLRRFNCFLFFVFVSLIECIHGGLNVTLRAKPSDIVHVGESVNLVCNFQGKFDRGFSVTWKHKGAVFGEECRAFREGYEIRCSPGKYDIANNFEFQIKSVKWGDRGIWYCAHNFNSSSVDLDVMSPATLTSLRPLPRSNGKKLEGKGTRVSPYNLLSPNLTQFECSTGCGHPMPNVKWTYSNRTSAGSLNQFVAGTEFTNCAGEGQADMTSARSVFSVKNCTEMGLYGHLLITCSLTGGQYRKTQSRSFFIVCPGLTTSQPYGGGFPAQTLTHGEVIGIAVGCAMALIITSFSILWFHRKRVKANRHTSV